MKILDLLESEEYGGFHVGQQVVVMRPKDFRLGWSSINPNLTDGSWVNQPRNELIIKDFGMTKAKDTHSGNDKEFPWVELVPKNGPNFEKRFAMNAIMTPKAFLEEVIGVSPTDKKAIAQKLWAGKGMEGGQLLLNIVRNLYPMHAAWFEREMNK